MADTGFWVPNDRLDRLGAAFRHTSSGLVEVEPAGGGYYAGPPPFDVSHGELVSTVADVHRLLRALVGQGHLEDVKVLEPDHVAQLSQDQVPPEAKSDDSFFPGFWDEMAWGWGTGIYTAPALAGRYGWSGGQGTTFWVDRDGTVGILLTQVELGERVNGLFDEFTKWPPRR